MKTYAYLRVSTDQQDADAQRHGVTAYAARHALAVDEWITDVKSGATSWTTRRLADLHKTMQPGDVLLVAELSRIGRSTLDVLDALRAFADIQAAVHIVKQNMLVDGSINSKIITTMLALAAEIEREFIRARTIEGMANAAANGRHPGRPPGPAETLKLTNRHAEIVKLLDAGVSQTAIAKLCQVGRNTVKRYIERHRLAERTTP